MTAKSNWLENAVLEHFLRNNTQSAVTPYIGLFLTANPGEDGSGGSEVSGPVGTTGYERQACGFSAASGGAVTNGGDIAWNAAITAWGTIVGFGIYDAASGGNLLYYGDFNTPRVIGIDDIFVILAGNLDITEL